MTTTAHLYVVPVLAVFDAIRNCSHCRRNTDDNCKAWRKARKAAAVLGQEARRLVKGVDDLRDATGGRTTNIYQFACGSVAYFAPDAPDFQEAGELKGDDLAKAVRILNRSGVQRSGRRKRVDTHLERARHDAPDTAYRKRSGDSVRRATPARLGRPGERPVRKHSPKLCRSVPEVL